MNYMEMINEAFNRKHLLVFETSGNVLVAPAYSYTPVNNRIPLIIDTSDYDTIEEYYKAIIHVVCNCMEYCDHYGDYTIDGVKERYDACWEVLNLLKEWYHEAL